MLRFGHVKAFRWAGRWATRSCPAIVARHYSAVPPKEIQTKPRFAVPTTQSPFSLWAQQRFLSSPLIHEIPIIELKELIESGPLVLIDVREPNEVALGQVGFLSPVM